MHSITSLSNPRVKYVVKLQQGRFRRESGRFLIDGFREIERALDCGFEICEIFFQNEIIAKFLGNEKRNEFFRKLSPLNVEMFDVSASVFEKIAFGERREGIVAVAKSQLIDWNELRLPTNPLIGVVERVEKPGNLGAILRSADGAGFDAIFVADPLCDIYNPNTIRASLGTVFHVPTIVDTSEMILRELLSRKIAIAAAKCDGSVPYTDFNWAGPAAIVLGTEADGLSEIWNHPEVRPIHLPMHGIADSLNVSNAAAILFYEARRNR